MMHICSSGCPCGMYNNQYYQSDDYSFSSAPPPPANDHHHQYYYEEESAAAADYGRDHTASMYSYSSSSVDCTLSLGTPSTRLCGGERAPPTESRRKSSGRGASSSDRRCANCDTTSTPLWRNGPRGPKSLCNACGIRYKKEERRASAAAAASANNGGGGSRGIDDMMHQSSTSWAHHSEMAPPAYSSYSSSAAAYGSGDMGYMDDEDRDSAFLSWRLNVHCS